ncbi:CBS domain-containing protein [Halobacterium rubrum]|uniref:CBS domain-containing protein n=1 Tax=Halobacterium TaxID=2239 RepID=UPI001F1EB629|nr:MULTISPECIES: CBS domain-containing protein [Halobacterium]MDH5020343.1 CBS domain-containing protein [Halobacterium rubrum]
MSHTVGDVPCNKLVTVPAEATLISAIETMFENDYTQLGIERGDEIVGMVSYRSISRVLSILRKMGADKNLPGRQVGIAIEEISPVVEPDEDLIVLFDLLSESPYVIVQNEESQLDILTNYDLLQYLQNSIEPFLLIEDVERSVRDLIRHAFPENLDETLQEFFDEKDIRTPADITDCSFGHYPQFMCQNWSQFDVYFEENGDFIRRLLSEVGDIRNKIFHFRSDSYDSELEEELLIFAHGYFQRRLPDADMKSS